MGLHKYCVDFNDFYNMRRSMKKCKKCGERLQIKKRSFLRACGTKVKKSKKKVIGIF